jgi:Arc/MetJ-type ribon-helix-helix transcriptional regulator
MEEFVAEKVKAGEFPSAEAVVEDAIARMMRDERALTDEDVEAINQAEEEMDRGEFVDFDTLAAEMRQKYCK